MEYVRRISLSESGVFSGKTSRSAQLDFELTERCDNNCIHCSINLPAGDASARDKELTTAELRGILTEAAGLGTLQVRFTGGEPLLRPDFEEIYLFARRLGLKVLLFTNARLITRRLADLLARIPPLALIEISVYGMSPDSYEAVTRAEGSFAQFMRGVELLRERNIPFVVKAPVLPPNRDEMDRFEAWAAQIPRMDATPAYSMFFDKRHRRDDPDKDRMIESLRLSPEDGLAIMMRDGRRFRRDMAAFCGRFLGAPGDVLFRCGAGKHLCVDAYGRVQPCLSLRDPELTYDLRKGSLEEALRDFFPRLDELRAENPEYLKRCARCFLSSLCEQCPAKSWTETGTLDTPIEYFCSIAHATARMVGIIGPDENAWEVRDPRSRIERAFGK
jgi:radical SAM protein with 4Fe4S-binding SPASM domain